MSATVIVYPTVEPGLVVLTEAVLAMVRAGIRSVTVAVHAGSVPPGGQLLPWVVEVTVLTRSLSPVSGLLTVTE